MGFVAATLLFLHLNRRAMVNSVEPYLEWRRLKQPGENDAYDEDARRLAAAS